MSGFQFRPALTICTCIGLAILVTLGVWQVKRLQWKLDLIEKVEARTVSEPIDLSTVDARVKAGEDLEYQPVKVTGIFEHGLEAHVFGTWEGEAGWYIMTPLRLLKIAGNEVGRADRVMVNRGFVPPDLKERDARPQSILIDEVTLVGLYRSSKTPKGISAAISPSDMAPKERNEFHSRDVKVFMHHLDVALLPFILDSTGVEISGAKNTAEWPKGGTTRLTFNNRHLEYALTWFGLAVTLLVVFLAFSRKPRAT